MSQKFLSSVTLAGLASGSILKVNSDGLIVEAVAGTDYVSSVSYGDLNSLTDVVVSNPSADQILVYGQPLGGDPGVNVWYNKTPSFLNSASSIGALGDVTIGTTAVGQLLSWNGSAWVNWSPNFLTSYTESDPIYTASSWYTTINNSSNWDTAYGWGNHAGLYSLTSHTHNVFTQATSEVVGGEEVIIAGSNGFVPASGFDDTGKFLRADGTWQTVTTDLTGYATETWVGQQGYLTSFTETDPVFTQSAAYNVRTEDITAWDTAYGWGDHSEAGYLTSYTETDPIYTASSWYTTTNNSTNWNTAYGWGNHASAGYLTSYENNYISDVKVVDTNLVFTGEGGAYNESVDLSTLPFQAQGNYLTAESDTLATVAARGNISNTTLQIRTAGNAAGGNLQLGPYSDGAPKWAYITAQHFNSSTEPEGFTLIGGLAQNGQNAVVIGGNIYESNPATEIQFWTHTADTHSTGGTQIATIKPNGLGIGTTNPSYKLDLLGTTDAVVARLSQGYERVRYNTVDLLGYGDGHLWLIGNNNPSLVISSSWDWDQQIEINYVPGSPGAASGVLSIGQLTGQKNSATYTHGRTDFYVNGAVRSNINTYGVGIGREAASNEKFAVNASEGIWALSAYRSGVQIGGIHVNDSILNIQGSGGTEVRLSTSGNATWNGNVLATRTWVQAQGYLTSETDSQTLDWEAGGKNLTISNGNTVTLDGLATEEFVTSQGYITSVPTPTKLVSPNGTTVVAADSALPDAGHSFIHTLALGPGGNDGHILGMTWAGTTSVYGAQIYIDTDPTSTMAFRSRSAAGVWTSWTTLVHSGNIGSQSVNYASSAGSASTAATVTGQSSISYAAHSAGANDYNLELYSSDTGDSAKYVSLRFHQGSRYWGQIRYNNAGFRLTGGADDSLQNIYAGIYYATGGDSTNWNTAYNDKINSASFNTADGVLTLTQQDGGTVTVDLDGRYLTSETDSQELEWNQAEKLLTISNGNTVDLSQMASVSDIEDAGFITAESDTLATVTGRGASTATTVNFTAAGAAVNLTGLGSYITFKDQDNVWGGYVGFDGNTGRLEFPGRNARIVAGYNGTIELNTGASGYNSGRIHIPYGYLSVDNNYVSATAFHGQSIKVGTAGSTPTVNYGIFHQSGVGLGIASGAGGSGQGIDFWSHNGTSFFQSVRIAGSTGNVGIGTTSPSYKLDVNGNARFANEIYAGGLWSSSYGPRNSGEYVNFVDWNSSIKSRLSTSSGTLSVQNRRLSLGILDLNSGASPAQYRIKTTIPWNYGGSDFTVNIKGFRYGSAQMVSLSIGWHYYADQFYNRTAISNGAWAPTITLAKSPDGYVIIYIPDPSYWPKLYVESVYSSNSLDSYTSGWTWEDRDLSDCELIQEVPYKGLATSITGNSGTTSQTNFSSLTVNSNTVWHAGNDGSGSGLDADTVDGLQASAFLYNQVSQLANTNLNDLTTQGVYHSNSQYGTNSNIPYANYFTMVNLTNDADRQAQLWFGDTPGRMYWRARQGSSGWHGWEKVWTSSDFSNNSSNWDTAYGWGNHATANYWVTSNTDPQIVAASSVTFQYDVEIQGQLLETSSIRFKENIVDLEPVGDKVSQLRPVRYNKIGTDVQEIGLIAEEVAELFPEVVHYNEDGEAESLNYTRLSVLLLQTVKELSDRIQKLENK